jgi:undecaprenyl-diphosphatase
MSGLLDSAAGLASPWAYVVVGVLAALEASAFVGLFVPGETVVLFGGVLAAQGRVNLGGMMAVAAAGAVAGDSIGYEIGRHFGGRLRRSRLGGRVGDARWDRGAAYLASKGGRAIFLGRFVGLLRALVPALAGVGRMPYRTFLAWNMAGGILWSCGVVGLGYAAGGSYRRVERYAGQAGLLLLVVVVLIGGIVVVARWLARHPDEVQAFGRRQLERPVVMGFRTRYHRQLEFVARRLRPEGALGLSLTVSFLVVGVAGWAFGAVLQDVIAGESLASIDQPVLRFFVAHREPWATSAARAVTWLGSSAVLIPLLLAVGLGWWWRSGRRQPLGLLAGGYAGGWLLSTAVKDLVGRARPPHAVALTHVSGVAFPSGHATDATVAWLLLASLAAATTRRWPVKVAYWAGAVALCIVVGFTRLYLGVHWLTDVTGGFALGAAWVTILLSTTRAVPFLRRQPVGPRPGVPATRS